VTVHDELGLSADAPATLRARARHFVDASGSTAGAMPADRLLDAGLRALAQALEGAPHDRAVALDVLTADALVTRAIEQLASAPGDVEAECARCIHTLSAALPVP
jgi:hypothetical protein